MKSLTDTISNSTTFSPAIQSHLINEGFKSSTNNSYCAPHREKTCCIKRIELGSFIAYIYIFSTGIGVDIDYDCGGNSSVSFWEFDQSRPESSFEESYDQMVDYVNQYK